MRAISASTSAASATPGSSPWLHDFRSKLQVSDLERAKQVPATSLPPAAKEVMHKYQSELDQAAPGQFHSAAYSFTFQGQKVIAVDAQKGNFDLVSFFRPDGHSLGTGSQSFDGS